MRHDTRCSRRYRAVRWHCLVLNNWPLDEKNLRRSTSLLQAMTHSLTYHPPLNIHSPPHIHIHMRTPIPPLPLPLLAIAAWTNHRHPILLPQPPRILPYRPPHPPHLLLIPLHTIHTVTRQPVPVLLVDLLSSARSATGYAARRCRPRACCLYMRRCGRALGS